MKSGVVLPFGAGGASSLNVRRLTADSIISAGDQDLTDVLGSMPSRCTAESNGGPSAYPERGKLKQHGIKTAAGPSCEGTPRRETRPPWSRLDCLNPNPHV